MCILGNYPSTLVSLYAEGESSTSLQEWDAPIVGVFWVLDMTVLGKRKRSIVAAYL